MKHLFSYTIILVGLLFLTACGDDKKVTTNDLNCTSNSIYDYDDEKWYLSRTDLRECESNVNPNGYYGSGQSCGPGEVSARIPGSQSYSDNRLGNNDRFGSNTYRDDRFRNDTFRNDTYRDDRFRNRNDFTHSSNRNSRFEFGYDFDFGICIGDPRFCHQNVGQAYNARDYDRYTREPVRYESGNRSSNFRDSDGFIRVCIDRDYAYQDRGQWYVDDRRLSGGNLSNEDELIIFGIGVLTGVVLNEIFN